MRKYFILSFLLISIFLPSKSWAADFLSFLNIDEYKPFVDFDHDVIFPIDDRINELDADGYSIGYCNEYLQRGVAPFTPTGLKCAEVKNLWEERNRQFEIKLETYQGILQKKLEATSDPVERQRIETEIESVKKEKGEILGTLSESYQSSPVSAQNIAGDAKTYSCNFLNPWSFSVVGCGMYILTLVFTIILWILSLVLWLAAEALNLSIDISINQFHTYAFAEGVKDAWTVTRDLANIFFIFILLYIAINTVLNRGGWEKMIANVIIIALLVNFSAVIPRVIIDASNVLALQIYHNMVDKEVGNPPRPDISGAILNTSLELIGWNNLGYSYTPGERPGDEPLEMKGLLANSIGSAVIMVVIAFVLVTAAILFLYRTIMLLIAIITSPLAVMAWALPKQSSKADKWLSTLVSEATYAPVFLFFLYIALKVYTAQEFKSGDGLIPRVVMFIIFTSMVMFALMAAKSMGASGGAMAEKWGGKFKGLVTGAALGVGGAAGVYALGRTSQKILEQPWMKNLKKSGAGRLFNDLVVDKTLGKAAASKYGSSQSYKERVDKNADRVTQFKTAEDQAQYIASLGATDRAAAWGKLSERQKAEVLHHIDDTEAKAIAAGTPLTSAQQSLSLKIKGDGTDVNKGLVPPAGSEAWDKLEDEKERVRASKAARGARETVDKIGTATPPSTADIQNAVRNLKDKAVNRVDLNKLFHPDVVLELDGSQLRKIAEGPNFSTTAAMVNIGPGIPPSTVRQFVMDEVYRVSGAIPGGAAPTPAQLALLPPNLKSAYKYLESPHGYTYYA